MEIKKFLRILYRRKWLLIAIPLITVITTYFFVRHLPELYVSSARIETGLADPSQQLVNDQTQPQSEIDQRFSNLIQMMLMKKTVEQVSYQLILHDLTEPKPFRESSKLLKSFNAAQKQHAINIFKQKYAAMDDLGVADKTQDTLQDLLSSMDYDDVSLTSNLSVYRVNSSDFIEVDFTSENPELSAFVANTLCSEFISYYTVLIRDNQRKAVNYLASLLKSKQDKMDSITNELRNYKIQNHVLDLNEQAKTLYGQIADFETRRGEAVKDAASYSAALNDIDSKFDPTERKYAESSVSRINQDITSTRDMLGTLNDEYVKSGFDESYKPHIDSLKNKLSEQINQSSDKYTLSPVATKRDLVTQKMNMEVQLDLSKNSLNSLQEELNRLNQKVSSLVPHEAEVQSFENSYDVASKEYLDVLAKFNQASLVSNYSTQLKQAELALPSPPLPSKKMLLVAVAGIASFGFCFVVLFALFYFDHSIKTPKELANKTQIPVFGFINTLHTQPVNVAQAWKEDGSSKELSVYKNLLRDARYEIETAMHNEHVLAVTSLNEEEGKSFFAESLAYAFAIANKKVVLIDANFTNPTISTTTQSTIFAEDYFSGKPVSFNYSANTPVVMANRKTDRSLVEIADENIITQKMNELKQLADIIIIDAPGLQALNKSKEWLQYSDKVVAVFEAGQTINEASNNGILFLKNLNEKFVGWVLNKLPDDEARYLIKA